MKEVRSQKSEVTGHKSGVWCLVTVFLLFTVLVGCGINKDVYQKTVEESEARKAGMEQAQKEIAKLQEENQQIKNKVAGLSRQIEELTAAKEAASQTQQKLNIQAEDINTLKKEREGLLSKTEYLSRQVEELTAAKAGMEQAQKEIARLQGEKEQIRKRADELSRQIEELTAAKEAASQTQQKLNIQAEEINALKKEREELLSKAEYLNREVKRLKIKAGELSAEKEKELAGVKSAYENLMKEMKEEIDKGEIKITQAIDRLSVNMVEKILFDSGKAEIKPEGLKILGRVGNILKGITDKQIKIEGHTDNVKIGQRIKEKYPTNWELSTARATNVVRYLQDKVGIDPKLLSAAGYSEYKPIAANDTTEGRAQNRRMEIVLLPLDLGNVVEELKKK